MAAAIGSEQRWAILHPYQAAWRVEAAGRSVLTQARQWADRTVATRDFADALSYGIAEVNCALGSDSDSQCSGGRAGVLDALRNFALVLWQWSQLERAVGASRETLHTEAGPVPVPVQVQILRTVFLSH